MPRYAFKIEYDGSSFKGWQIQKEQLTVQGVINNALLKLDQSSQGITGAGRTDSGVHALGQVGHSDLKYNWESKSLIHALSYHVKPYPIAITKAAEVSENFHARFSARKRYYNYLFLVRNVPQIFNKYQAPQVNTTAPTPRGTLKPYLINNLGILSGYFLPELVNHCFKYYFIFMTKEKLRLIIYYPFD